jgi:hypothetical protein
MMAHNTCARLALEEQQEDLELEPRRCTTMMSCYCIRYYHDVVYYDILDLF